MSRVPEHLRDRWPALMLIEADKISWTEAEEKMSIDDVLDLIDACEYVDSKQSRVSE